MNRKKNLSGPIILLAIWILSSGCDSADSRPIGSIDRFLKTVELQPADADAWLNLGIAWRQAGDSSKSLQAFKKTLTLNPKHGEALFWLADSYSREGNHTAALQEYKKTVRINPNLAQGHSNLGAAYLKLKQPKQAISALNRAIELKPDFRNAYLNLGTAYDQLGDGQNAMHFTLIAEQLLSQPRSKTDERNRSLMRQIIVGLQNKYGIDPALLAGKIPSHQKLKTSAEIKTLQTLVKNNPENVFARYRLGNFYLYLKRYDEALIELKEVTRLYKNAATAYNNIAVAYIQTERYERAQDALKKALTINPKFSGALANLQNLCKTHPMSGCLGLHFLKYKTGFLASP